MVCDIPVYIAHRDNRKRRGGLSVYSAGRMQPYFPGTNRIPLEARTMDGNLLACIRIGARTAYNVRFRSPLFTRNAIRGAVRLHGHSPSQEEIRFLRNLPRSTAAHGGRFSHHSDSWQLQ